MKNLFILLILLVPALLPSVVLGQETGEENDPVKLFQQGQEAHEKGDLAKALELYDAALKEVPEFPEAEYQKGAALVSLGRLNEAETSFRRALELRADWTLPITSLGSLLIRTNKPAEAEKFLLQATKADAQNFQAFASLADVYLITRPPAEILKGLLAQLQTLSAKVKTPASIWAARAAIERSLGDNAAARGSATRALGLDPKNLLALHERASASINLGDAAGALNDANDILKISPGLAGGKLLAARAQIAGDRLAEAVKLLDSLDEKTRQTAEYKELRAAVSGSQEATVDIAALEKEIEKAPANVVALSRLCNAARKTDPAKALDYCRRASELEPANVNHAIGYAAALIQSKQYEPAVGLLRRVIAAMPDNFTAHANLATALNQLKRYPEAIMEFEWLIEHKPDLLAAYYFLGAANDRMQKYPAAMAHYQKYLSLADPVVNKAEIEDINLRMPGLKKEVEKLQKKSKN